MNRRTLLTTLGIGLAAAVSSITLLNRSDKSESAVQRGYPLSFHSSPLMMGSTIAIAPSDGSLELFNGPRIIGGVPDFGYFGVFSHGRYINGETPESALKVLQLLSLKILYLETKPVRDFISNEAESAYDWLRKGFPLLPSFNRKDDYLNRIIS